MQKILSVLSAAALLFVLSGDDASARRSDCSGLFECLFGAGASFSNTRGRVNWSKAGKYRPGSIVVSTRERALYYTLDKSTAIRYKVGVGRQGFQWSGKSRIVQKKKWPSWTPPARMRAREAAKGRKLPVTMPGGPNNPLGARALYIGGTLYRIHGTNNARSIGQAMSSGCIRMMNSDVKDLYSRVRVGAPVYVYH